MSDACGRSAPKPGLPTFVAGIAVLVGAAAGSVHAQSRDELSAYAPFLDSLMSASGVPGISFALFDREGVLWEYVSGTKSAESSEPVGPRTVFEAASISKPVFAFMLQGMALEGAMDLTRPLVELVDPLPDLGYDARSALLTPELLLSHQGGLPNWRTRMNLDAVVYDELFGPADTLRFVSDPGERYLYSGEGFVLLQRVVEARTAKSLPELAAERVFVPLGMGRTSFAFDARAKEDFALGHSQDGRPDKWGLSVPLASSTLHTTGSDLARFGARLAAAISSGDPMAGIARPRVLVGERDGVRLSWGLGLGVVDTPEGRYVYHGGNNVIFIADFLYGVEEDLGYVLLTNSAKGEAMIEAVERRVFGRNVRP